mmetsp:Transcript_19418/g.42205  ORF Transcript_19418/g.42205 Transcript_19418/m.42205 type:complete len:545 (+) Transcript_19418:209-1843(+)|eukprot:CAMPEP_0168169332 /NCGR_PEP_ID=MMETSP0139_2-20121125/3582_1 /TAXON_ID=44445 /ORGANISM="Pseudo-nitzschia australis, Strain 10249 10 AB" /LENGTH=544 /DNA_ID=CAMNT_0008086745 /DNA_START=216 /DNA_END=1850 /DNA_ORIENTATION=+
MKYYGFYFAMLASPTAICGFAPTYQNNARQTQAQTALDMSSTIVVVSPPGGVGEVAAVKAACLGAAVRWFVISDPGEDDNGIASSASVVTLAPQALRDIADASGSLELAGAKVQDLTKGGESERSAVSQWCGAADGLICTYDGAENGKSGDPKGFRAALRLAANEASKAVAGPQVAVLSAEDDLEDNNAEIKSNDEESGGISNLVGSLLGGGAVSTPSTLPRSLSASNSGDICVVRHGELFGIAESSPEFSPLIGGPRREPVITEEYTMRTVRVDPFVVSGNVMGSSSQLKSCRHSVGESAALFATKKLSIPTSSSDSSKRSPAVISISSQSGTDKCTLEQWEEELDRVQGLVDSGKASALFSSQDMIVEDTERLADWLATKWAPTVMKTYEIAGIRIGGRPVAAMRSGEGKVDISWQELVNFDSVTVGKMILEVSKDGITATRGPGDASKGYGAVSTMPLNGEDVLVRRLAEAASQAMDKGLAKKVRRKKPVKAAVEAPKPVSSLQSAGSVVNTKPPAPESSAGPRQAGARRSTPRDRGTKKQ